MYILRVVVNFLRVAEERTIFKNPINQKTIPFLKITVWFYEEKMVC
jgi:hypothetical protein